MALKSPLYIISLDLFSAFWHSLIANVKDDGQRCDASNEDGMVASQVRPNILVKSNLFSVHIHESKFRYGWIQSPSKSTGPAPIQPLDIAPQFDLSFTQPIVPSIYLDWKEIHPDLGTPWRPWLSNLSLPLSLWSGLMFRYDIWASSKPIVAHLKTCMHTAILLNVHCKTWKTCLWHRQTLLRSITQCLLVLDKMF